MSYSAFYVYNILVEYNQIPQKWEKYDFDFATVQTRIIAGVLLYLGYIAIIYFRKAKTKTYVPLLMLCTITIITIMIDGIGFHESLKVRVSPLKDIQYYQSILFSFIAMILTTFVFKKISKNKTKKITHPEETSPSHHTN